MDILETLIQLRDDLKIWVTANLSALNSKIEENTIPIDGELSADSTNPVQNKVIYEKNQQIFVKISELTALIDSIESFSGDYNDLKNAPAILEDESGNMIIADNNGNVIFKADVDGIHSTALTLNGKNIATLIDNKVDKEDGKGLSSNDYTDADKAKLALISSDMASASIDSELSTTSDNPVKNKVITNVLIELQELVGNDPVADQIRDAISKINNFSGDYQDLTNAPNITEDDSNTVFFADNNGNIVAKVDKDGVHAAGLMLNGENVLNRINTKFNEINETIENYDRLRVGLVPLGTRIEANTELNSIEMIRVGSYYCASNATTATLLNCPTQRAFIMQVYSPISTNVDNEETNQWVYRVRKILTYEGTEFTQTVYSGSEPGVFIYKPWQSVVKMEYSTTDLTTGSSTLATGNLYVVYE